jgi:DNA-binding transcriptional regulator/RsmH inhibitor MraZ
MDFFERKLDDKNRLTIPAELRAELGEDRLVITRGFENDKQNYLHMFPEKIWNEEVEPALTGSILDKNVADLNVQFRMGKTISGLDAKQGRATFEQHLLDYAGIDRDVVAVRAGKYWRVMAPSKS